MSETPQLSSSSYMVIRSMRMSGMFVPLDVLLSPNCVVAVVGELARGYIMPGFSG
jgi:hypothetical protein